MITTNDDDLAQYMRELRNQGQDFRYNHIHLGYNYRMTNVTAAIGKTQMNKVDDIWENKNRLARRYNEAFADDQFISTPYIPEYVTRHSWYMYAISLDERIDRDNIVKMLSEMGIDTRLSFPPIHIQPYYQKKYGFHQQSFPVSYNAWARKIDLPIGPTLTADEQEYVIEKLRLVIGDQL